MGQPHHPESEFREAYKSWVVAREAYNRSPAADDSPEAKALFDHLIEIEDLIADMRPQTVEAYAMKIIIADKCGDMTFSSQTAALAAEAYEIVGMEAA